MQMIDVTVSLQVRVLGRGVQWSLIGGKKKMYTREEDIAFIPEFVRKFPARLAWYPCGEESIKSIWKEGEAKLGRLLDESYCLSHSSRPMRLVSDWSARSRLPAGARVNISRVWPRPSKLVFNIPLPKPAGVKRETCWPVRKIFGFCFYVLLVWKYQRN